MSVSFPRDMPDTGAAGQEFEPLRVDYSAPEASGFQGAIQAGFPLWMATWTLGRMGQLRSDIWRAWVMTLRGRQRRFYGRDLARPRPLAHIAGLPGGWAGDAADWAHTIDLNGNAQLALSGVNSGLKLSIGDYVGFRWTNGSAPRRALVRVVEPAEAAGGSITAVVEPPLPPVVPGSAVAYLERPACIMRLVPEETQLGAIDRRLAIGGGKIVALQDLRE